jgi:creatine kinase
VFDARGIFHNDEKKLFVWLNEEDHMRIVSMQKGDNIVEVVERFIFACNQVQTVLKSKGYDFMWNQHLGYILTCPSNLGTGLRAGAMMQIPYLSSKPYFKDLVRAMELQARGGRGVDSAAVGGLYDISNKDRIGKGEVDLCNALIEGLAQLVKWETMADDGEEQEAENQEKMAS